MRAAVPERCAACRARGSPLAIPGRPHARGCARGRPPTSCVVARAAHAAALHLHYHPNIPVSFGFLFASVGGSLAAVPLSGFRVTKAWGCCLIALYLTAILTAVAVELGALPLGGSA